MPAGDRWRFRPARFGVAPGAIVLLLAGCSMFGVPSAPSPTPSATESIVSGPLCAELPAGTNPGAPPSLTAMSAAEALTWIPVATDIEAAARAAGLDDDLATAPGITILAPTDDAFRETIDEDTWDALLFFRQDEMADVVEAHVIDGQLSLADLRAAGSVTTRAGDTLEITAADGAMIRIDDEAQTLCGDYRVANARIHVIDAVLGELPPPGPPDAPSGSGGVSPASSPPAAPSGGSPGGPASPSPAGASPSSADPGGY
jgi:uncharacterized surface protein with fasciclin (FAS1) repeats